jgi:hypothetical protein
MNNLAAISWDKIQVKPEFEMSLNYAQNDVFIGS